MIGHGGGEWKVVGLGLVVPVRSRIDQVVVAKENVYISHHANLVSFFGVLGPDVGGGQLPVIARSRAGQFDVGKKPRNLVKPLILDKQVMVEHPGRYGGGIKVQWGGILVPGDFGARREAPTGFDFEIGYNEVGVDDFERIDIFMVVFEVRLGLA